MKKILSLFMALAVMAFVASPALAATSVIFNNIPDPQPGNVPSLGVEAYSMPEIGLQTQFLGTNRLNPKITVLMSSWACENGTWVAGNCSTSTDATFSHPITLNVYSVNPDNTPGTKIATLTQTFTMPYRPSADTTNCTGGRWFDGTNCFNGKAFTISFDLTGVTLPDKVILGVAYNTSHNGYSPVGTQACNSSSSGCAYDSLNVGLVGSPSIGTVLPSTDDIYQNSLYGGFYCDKGISGTGTFRLDAGCWADQQTAFKVEASAPIIPDSQQASIYKVTSCDSSNITNDPYQGHVTLVTPDGKNDLMLQGVIQGLVPDTQYTVWIRNLLPSYSGTFINRYIPLGYFALTTFTTNKKGAGNFSYKINKADLPSGTYSIQVALNVNTQNFPSGEYGCTKAATSTDFLKVYVGQ
jgi:hypothetical protein